MNNPAADVPGPRPRPALQGMKPYQAGKTVPKAVKLSSNENPLGPSPLAVEALHRAADSISVYPDGSSLGLRKRILQELGIPGLTAEHLLVGNGSDELLSMIAGTYLLPGQTGLTARETFSEYAYSIRLWGGRLKALPLEEGRFPLDSLAEAAEGLAEKDSSGPGIIYLCNPNNPTGTYFSGDELIRFMDRIPPECPVVLDEAYADFADAEDYPCSPGLLGRYPNLFITRTFSKIYGLAALRIGYLISRPGNVAAVARTKQPFNVGGLAQAAAEAALGDRDFWERSRRTAWEGRRFLGEELMKDGIPFYPTQANFLCLQPGAVLRKGDREADSREFFEALLAEGVAIRPLASFGLPNRIRVTLGTLDQMQLFLDGLRRVLAGRRMEGGALNR